MVRDQVNRVKATKEPDMRALVDSGNVEDMVRAARAVPDVLTFGQLTNLQIHC